MTIPLECYDEQFVNQNLINRAQQNAGQLGFKGEIKNNNEIVKLTFNINS